MHVSLILCCLIIAECSNGTGLLLRQVMMRKMRKRIGGLFKEVEKVWWDLLAGTVRVSF